MATGLQPQQWIGRCAVVFIGLAALVPSSAFAQTDRDVNWLRFVPGDAHFYVELKDLDGIRRRFRHLGIWGVVRRLTEGSDPTTTQPTHRQAGEMLGMNPETAITQILGRRSALFATSPAKWQSGVILAEVDRSADIRRLLVKWGAKRRGNEGKVRRYVLRGGTLLAVSDRLLVLGAANDPEGLWGRSVLLLSGKLGPHLQGTPKFASMQARLQGDHGGFAYMAWPENDPYAIAKCQRLVLGFTLTDSELHCEVHGQRRNVTETLTSCDVELIRSLPADTLAAWSSSFDTEILRSPPPGTVLDDDRSLIGVFVETLRMLDRSPDQFLRKLGPRITIAIGSSSEQASEAFPFPPATILWQAQDAREHAKKLDMIISLFATLMQVAAAPGSQKLIEVETQTFEDVTLHIVKVGPILAKRFGLEFLNQIEVCWAGLDHHVLFSLSTEHVKKLIRSRCGRTEQLGAGAEMEAILPTRRKNEPAVEWFFLRGTEISRILTDWLKYLIKKHPAAVSDRWWQEWAERRLRDHGRLSIGLRSDEGSAVVEEIGADSPALGILQVGDRIVSAAGQSVTGKHPAQEVRRRYESRGAVTGFELGILRRGKRMDVKVAVSPVPDVNLQDFKPIHALGQITILLHRVRTMTISRYGTNPDRLDLDILIRWNTSSKGSAR
ncbi:MAG: hypothetical protein MI923_13235 [Phycisphaerales bacterium]|nr:hypothetical protein [Phycisphaerales bacterium]